MSMESIRIERSSILKLRTVLEYCDRVISDIPDNDRTPSWDGAIFLYKSSSLVKENILGKIHVQVKGKEVNHLKSKKITYQVDVSDLKNFRGVGGTIFFVIHLLAAEQFKIYYNSLLPLELDRMLSAIEPQQKTKSISLAEFPKDVEGILYILSSFIIDSQKQHSFQNGVLISDIPMGNFDNFTFTTTIINGCVENIFKYPAYIYGRYESLNIEIPLNQIMIESMSHSIKKKVIIGNEVYYDQILIEKGNEILRIKFGLAFEMDMSPKKINYVEKGDLEERIQDLTAFVALIKNNFAFSVEGVLKTTEIPKHGCNSQYYKRRLKFLNDLQSLLIRLNVKDKIDLDKLSNEATQGLETFIDAIMNDSAVSLDNVEEELLPVNFKYSNLTFMVLAKKTNANKYYLSNIFVNPIGPVYLKFSNRDETIESCIFISLKKENFLEVSNINYENVSKALCSVSYSKKYGELVNFLILEMLLAFDEKKNKDLIETVVTIAKWLIGQENDCINSCMYNLNYLQAVKRTRNLTDEENEALIQMKINEVGEDESTKCKILAGINILLENKIEYEHNFKRMAKSAQEEFVRFPIYNLTNIWIER